MQAWNLFFDKNHTFFNLSYLELKFICQFHDWDWLIKLLHECPNLQILVIDKVCWVWGWFLSFVVFFNLLCYLYCWLDRKMVSPKQVWTKIGYIHDLFPKAFHQNLKDAVSEIMKDRKVSFNLQDILCRMQVICRPWQFALTLVQTKGRSLKWLKTYPPAQGVLQLVNFYLNSLHLTSCKQFLVGHLYISNLWDIDVNSRILTCFVYNLCVSLLMSICELRLILFILWNC